MPGSINATTGEPEPLTFVPDNGPAFRGAEFVGFFARRPALRHVRTRHHAPETNGVAERFNRSLEYEHLCREEIRDVIALRDEVEAYRALYNWVRPHGSLGQLPPMARYLGEQPDEPLDPTYPAAKVSRKVDAEHLRGPQGRHRRPPRQPAGALVVPEATIGPEGAVAPAAGSRVTATTDPGVAVGDMPLAVASPSLPTGKSPTATGAASPTIDQAVYTCEPLVGSRPRIVIRVVPSAPMTARPVAVPSSPASSAATEPG